MVKTAGILLTQTTCTVKKSSIPGPERSLTCFPVLKNHQSVIKCNLGLKSDVIQKLLALDLSQK